jgi:hypothetical protein
MRSRADALGVFVKAPEPGRVKTRLAADIGARRAAELYRRLGRTVVAQCVAPDSYPTFVWYTPAREGDAIRSWLADLDVAAYLRQRAGGLGRRLAATFRHHFAGGARRVIIIGSDCPEVGVPLIRRAFDALTTDDLVIGPAGDGGFYLLGLRAPAPGLFRRVRWSTDAVFGQVMANVKALGLSAAVLPSLRDVDTVADAQALGFMTG